MNYITKYVSAVCLALFMGSAQAATIEFGDYTNGDMVKTVSGIWTYNDRIHFDTSGVYKMSFKDLQFAGQFDYVGAMISTTDQKVTSVTIKNGQSSSVLPIEFAVGEQDYWISLFAFTNSEANVGTLGLNIDWVGDVSEVPAPPAVVLMFTSLLGLVSMVRRRQRQGKNRNLVNIG